MKPASSTIVVILRDRFSTARESFESLIAQNSSNFPVIYVDSCHPRPWADRLDTMAKEGKITLIRTGFHLSQHEAYNLAFPLVRTKYVIFVDNDVLFSPGWAEKLIACAEQTGATAVYPMITEPSPEGMSIHMCGGDCGVYEEDGQLWYHSLHPHSKQPATTELPRCRTGVLEYHAFLVRSETLQKIGPFDEKCWHALNHDDFSLMIRAAGGEIWVEPASVIVYRPPPPIEWEDLGFFINRWSANKTATSLRHFSQKWSVQIPECVPRWFNGFRRRIHVPLRNIVRRYFGDGLLGKMMWRLVWAAEPVISWAVEICSHVPNRRERLEALGPWRAPGLDQAKIQAFAEKMFREPRELSREVSDFDEQEAVVSVAV
jgi:GT2 family glycosyltransferase